MSAVSRMSSVWKVTYLLFYLLNTLNSKLSLLMDDLVSFVYRHGDMMLVVAEYNECLRPNKMYKICSDASSSLDYIRN